MLKAELGEANNISKNCLVVKNIMAVSNLKNIPTFEPPVASLVLQPNPDSHTCTVRNLKRRALNVLRKSADQPQLAHHPPQVHPAAPAELLSNHYRYLVQITHSTNKCPR